MADNTPDRVHRIIVLGLALVILVGLYSLILRLIEVLVSMDAKLGATLLTVAGTIVVSVATIALTRYFESLATIQKELREKKVPVYEDLLGFLLRIMMSSSERPGPSSDETFEFLSRFTERVMVWGSDDVIRSWSNFRIALVKDPAAAKTLLVKYEEVIRAIRKDLGHKNTDLKSGRFVSLFVNDFDQLEN